VYGLTHYLGLKLNAVTVLNLKCLMGFSVEFCAHFARSFMLARGTREERAAVCVQDLGLPVASAALTTFLGIVAIAASPWKYLRLYFFLHYVVIQAVVFYNGLVLLPVLLSILGPRSTAEEAAADHAKRRVMQKGAAA
jgi:Niemann-Pick C1 protein